MCSIPVLIIHLLARVADLSKIRDLERKKPCAPGLHLKPMGNLDHKEFPKRYIIPGHVEHGYEATVYSLEVP